VPAARHRPSRSGGNGTGTHCSIAARSVRAHLLLCVPQDATLEISLRRFLTALAGFFPAAAMWPGPLPRLANIPARVTDLAAVSARRQADRQFTVPQLTTEGVTIKQSRRSICASDPARSFSGRNGPAKPKRIPPFAPRASWCVMTFRARNGRARSSIAVRVVGANGKDAGWSNYANVDVIAPRTSPPNVRAEMTRGGLRLTWRAHGDHFRVLRRFGGQRRDMTWSRR